MWSRHNSNFCITSTITVTYNSWHILIRRWIKILLLQLQSAKLFQIEWGNCPVQWIQITHNTHASWHVYHCCCCCSKKAISCSSIERGRERGENVTRFVPSCLHLHELASSLHRQLVQRCTENIVSPFHPPVITTTTTIIVWEKQNIRSVSLRKLT